MSILLNGGIDNLGTVLSSVTLILKKELINLKSRSTTNLSLFFFTHLILMFRMKGKIMENFGTRNFSSPPPPPNTKF